MGVMICADVGDRAWDRKVPKPALDEIKLAKGKVYEMTEKPWWYVFVFVNCLTIRDTLAGIHYAESQEQKVETGGAAFEPFLVRRLWACIVYCTGRTIGSLKHVAWERSCVGEKSWCNGLCRDYDAEKEAWGWSRPAPVSQKMGGDGTSENKTARKKVRQYDLIPLLLKQHESAHEC